MKIIEAIMIRNDYRATPRICAQKSISRILRQKITIEHTLLDQLNKISKNVVVHWLDGNSF